MTKIGRNEPCPCGSGKKYKKCCINKEIALSGSKPAILKYHWSLEKIDRLNTKEIIYKLHQFGVPFKENDFIEQAKHFNSAYALGETWITENQIVARGLDEDFIWMSCAILWERLLPDRINTEQIDKLMQDGYDDIREGEIVNGCNKWLKVWSYLKENFTPEMRSVDDAEIGFKGMQNISNWSQDFEMELWNAAVEDTRYHHERIEYCDGFCTYFPHSPELTMVKMQRAKADSLYAIGELEKGEEVYQRLIDTYPNNVWSYIGWGDIYAFGVKTSNLAIDRERAKQIYGMALNKEMEDHHILLERMASLNAE